MLCVCAGIVVGDTPCIVSEEALCKRLCCEPTVCIRRFDVLSRWRDSCDLSVLIFERDEDWHEINVLGNFLFVFRYSVLHLNDVISCQHIAANVKYVRGFSGKSSECSAYLFKTIKKLLLSGCESVIVN